MKKCLLFIFSTLICLQTTFADNLVVSNVSIPQGGNTVVEVSLSNTEKTYTAGQMALRLPEGISAVTDLTGSPFMEKGERLMSTNHTLGSSHLSNGMNQFTIFSISSETIAGTEGVLFRIAISAGNNLGVGTVLYGQFVNIEMTTTDATPCLFNDISFQITIVEPTDPWITIDENSTTLPEESDGDVQIKVKRTIKADSWSTICLPFAMTEEQVYEAFGEDVQLAEFMEYASDDESTVVNVIFDSARLAEDGFFANYPYIIKTSKDITEFVVTSTIEPDEENAIVEFTNGRTGSRKEVYGTFYGTLTAGGKVPNNCLFLNDGNFWYSKGNSDIKAFRGYFDFVDLFAGVEEDASANMRIVLTDETTGVETVVNEVTDGVWYTLLGIRISEPTSKGIYMKDGKKIYVK